MWICASSSGGSVVIGLTVISSVVMGLTVMSSVVVSSVEKSYPVEL